MPQRETVFVSYSHKNKRWLQRLRVHLTPYERKGVVEIWDDTRIAPGDKWHSEIADAIERAAASIVLISPDFLASDFVVEHELPKMLRKAERGGARILPIIVEPCEFTLAILWALQSNGAEFTLSELENTLDIRSRKRAYEAVNRLVSEGWIEKTKKAGVTKYRLTQEGDRQLQRLAAASDGPVRRFTSRR